MPRRKRTEIGISEEVKIAVNLAITKFQNEEKSEYAFPSSLSSNERKYIHNYAATLGLKTKSRGKDPNRFITIFKKNNCTILQTDASFQMGRISQHHALSLIQRYPVTEKEKKDLTPPGERDRINISGFHETKELNCTTGRLSNVIPQIPNDPNFKSTGILHSRQSLPVWQHRNQIMEVISRNSVILISGETGSGKTTQVPQYILEYCTQEKQPCRIICSEPRRLAALSVAERVSCERSEGIGQTVGYQIRLESKVSPRTLLTFCTNGVLLRTLMGSDSALRNVTHVILDEIHERDRFSDFLLLILRDKLLRYRHLRLILMSATFDLKLLAEYFGNCASIEVPGKCYEVKPYYLEDVLRFTKYCSPAMKNYALSLNKKDPKNLLLQKWCEEHNLIQTQKSYACEQEVYTESDASAVANFSKESDFSENESLDPSVAVKMDNLLKAAWSLGSDEAFDDLLKFIDHEQIPLDYQHKDSGMTTLIASASHGKIHIVEYLLDLGVNVNNCSPNDWNALQWAKYFDQTEVAELLENYMKFNSTSLTNIEEDIEKPMDILTEDERQLLDIYHHSFNDEEIDIDLICALICSICSSFDIQEAGKAKGAILVFLSGYDEIVNLRDKIVNYSDWFDPDKFVLYCLHSQMQCSDQKRVFKPVPANIRKIILSTNLAETSITIEDIVYVIDSGKIKEKTYDALLGVSSLKSVWISQSNAFQRKGRAGRCRSGFCFHLFSKIRLSNMLAHQVPEMLRIPIHELCLQTKLLAPNVSIADFLSKALDPPSRVCVAKSVQLLKTIGALNDYEQLTELGLHLLDLPIEPNLGKMVLYSVVLKCLDPVLTIVCSLAYRDPFVIPNNPADKRAAFEARKKLAAGTCSDHMILLRGFQAWQKAKSENYERQFCFQNFVSAATMEIIVGMRSQLLGQLRASGFVRARGPGDIRDLNSNSENWAVVKAALCAGSYPNLIRVDRDRQQLTTEKESKIRFHPSSVLHANSNCPNNFSRKNQSKFLSSLPSDWLSYEEMIRIGRLSYARFCTLLSPITIALFAGSSWLSDSFIETKSLSTPFAFEDQDSDSEIEDSTSKEKSYFKIDSWISFQVNPDIAQLAFQIRQKWHALFLRRMYSPSKPLSQAEDAVIKAVVEILSIEEQALGLQQPTGIGQRPRPMSTDFCPPVSNLSSPRSNFKNNYRSSTKSSKFFGDNMR